MMPTHIRAGGKCYSKLQLAKEALRRSTIVQCDGEVVKVTKNRRMLYDHVATLKRLANEDGTITIKGLSPKEYNAFQMFLKARGWVWANKRSTYKRINNVD
jgi:hypothetical protein